jgi:hypothetical protein
MSRGCYAVRSRRDTACVRYGSPRRREAYEGDIAADVLVMGQPHLADAALGVQPRQRVTLAGVRLVGDGGGLGDKGRLVQSGQGLLHVAVGDALQDAAHLGRGHGGEAGMRVAAVLVELALQELVEWLG